MKRQWTLDELLRNFTLQPAEVELIPDTSDSGRLGFAALLKYFQHEGHFPHRRHDIPEDVIVYLASQLDVLPEAYNHYRWEGRTITRHRVQIREWLGFRPYTESDGPELGMWLKDEKLSKTHDTSLLVTAAYAYLHDRKIEPPTEGQVERLVRSTIKRYEEAFTAKIADKLAVESQLALENLLYPLDHQKGMASQTPFQKLKITSGRVGVKSIQRAAERLKVLQEMGLPEGLFDSVSLKIVERYRQRAAVETPSLMRRHAKPLRYTLLAAFCWMRRREITDDLAEMLIQIVHKIGVKAERRVHQEVLADLTRVYGKSRLLYRIADAALDDPEGTIKDVIFPVVSREKLEDVIKEYQSSGPAYRYDVRRKMRRSYGHHYRQMLPEILDVLRFRTKNPTYQPVLMALELVRKYVRSKRKYYPRKEDVPIQGIVRAGLQDLVIEHTEKRGLPKVNRLHYEVCVLEKIREGLRCKAIWVEGADKYRNPDEDLPADFPKRRDEYCLALGQPLMAGDFIAQLQREMREGLNILNESIPRDLTVDILSGNGGWIKVAPLQAMPEPIHWNHLKQAVSRSWPMIRLLDVLKEADMRANFTDCFHSVSSREVLDRPDLQKRLLLCLYGLGSNTGLKRVSLTNTGERYGDLYYVYQRYIHKDALREAVAKVVNATLHARDPRIWGEGTTACASDARQFAAWDQNLLTEWHLRYHGRGVVVYWHVSRQHLCIYSQLRACSSSEVAAMIEGVLRHCTDMEVEKNYVDSHGQSEIGFAFCRLLGFQLMPRLRRIGEQRLYRPDTRAVYDHLAPVLTRPIDWDLIRDHYDDMLWYATALRLGTADSEAILRRFKRAYPQHPTYRALAELGKAAKTIFLCHYLSSEDVRREVHEGLNVVETWNSVNRFIYFGRSGEFSTNDLAAQELMMLSLHLLQASMVYINTLMIQQVFAEEPDWYERMETRDWQAVSPLIHAHFNPYGTFELNMHERLPLSA